MFILFLKQINPVMVCHRCFSLLKPLQVPSTKAKFSPSSRTSLQKPSALCPGASGQPKASTRGSQELLQPESSFTPGAKGILCPMALEVHHTTAAAHMYPAHTRQSTFQPPLAEHRKFSLSWGIQCWLEWFKCADLDKKVLNSGEMYYQDMRRFPQMTFWSFFPQLPKIKVYMAGNTQTGPQEVNPLPSPNSQCWAGHLSQNGLWVGLSSTDSLC